MLEFLILGLGAGAVYALLGHGIVLIFRGSGILNLAQGAMAMLAAYVCTDLAVQSGWSSVTAIVVVILGITLIGVLIELLIMRRISNASPLTRLIAALGVYLTIYAFAVLMWSYTPGLAVSVFPSGPVDVLGVTVPQNRLWTFGVAVAITALLWSVWRFTRIGWLTEAVAENELAAASLGWSTQLVATGTWAAGAALAAVSGILIAPLTQLNVAAMSLLVIPGLAAALIGRFRSFPITLLGGLLIGVLQAEVNNYVHVTGAADAVPFLVIIAALVITGTALPLRGHQFDRLPLVGTGRVRPPVVVTSVAIGLAVLIVVSAQDWLAAIGATFGVAVILLSLVVLVGYAGQLSLAQYALAGLGALFAAQLVANSGWSFIPAAIVGTLGTALVGIVFALPALRARGVNLAVVTLGLGVAVQAVIFNNSTYAGGIDGIPVGHQSLFGWSIDTIEHPGRYAGVCAVVFLLAGLCVANLRRGRTGRRFLAVRANERAAAASGINVYAVKLTAFAVSGALAGVGGILLAFGSSSATFGVYTPLNSIMAVAMAVIGGIGFIAGPLIGAQLSPSSWGSIISLHWNQVGDYLPLIGGVVLIVNLVVAQEGVAEQMLGKLRRRMWPRTSAGELAGEAVEPHKVTPRTLSIEDLTVRYGGVTALEDVTFEVGPGEVVGLIGPNGAGKTSLMDAVTGFTASSGTVEIEGRDITGWSAHRRARAGVIRSFQGLELFSDLTLRENILAASEPRTGYDLARDLVHPGVSTLTPTARAAIREFGLEKLLDRRPDELSTGQQRLVAVVRAVASEPSILLLDEPVAGLGERESLEFARLVRRLAEAWGMAVLVIEHDMSFVMGLCDRLVVLSFGREIAQGTPDQVRRDPAAVAAYLGEETPDEPDGTLMTTETVTH